jgi:hypothetical protein
LHFLTQNKVTVMKSKIIKVLFTVVTASALGACGGSSDSSDSGGDAISASCKMNGNVATVTTSGCLVKAGNNIQSALCVGSSLRILTGTNISAETLRSSGSSMPNGSTFNGVKLSCG